MNICFTVLTKTYYRVVTKNCMKKTNTLYIVKISIIQYKLCGVGHNKLGQLQFKI